MGERLLVCAVQGLEIGGLNEVLLHFYLKILGKLKITPFDKL